jgi:hypothetical protein
MWPRCAGEANYEFTVCEELQGGVFDGDEDGVWYIRIIGECD